VLWRIYAVLGSTAACTAVENESIRSRAGEAVLGMSDHYDRIFVGSSTALMGIDPEIVDERAGGRSFNAGQFGYFPVNIIAEVAEEIITAKAASTIVYVMDSWVGAAALDDRRLVDSHGRSDHALWLSKVFRNRDVFFFWIGRLLRGEAIPPARAWHEHLQAGGRFASFDGIEPRPSGYQETFGLMNRHWNSYYRPTLFGEQQLAYLHRIFDLCWIAGIRLIVVRPPEYIRTYEEERAIHTALSAFLSENGALYGFVHLDYSLENSFPHDRSELFFDVHHLNSEGARAFSKKLAQALYDVER
jgi:hypothetical protein